MIQMSYISSAPQPMSTVQLLALLQQCLRHNPDDGITGMLLYGNQTFVQTLEGEEQTVEDLYRKIQNDPRHTNIRFLHRKIIGDRQYSDWSMGFRRISDRELEKIEGLGDFSEKDFNFDYLTEHAVVTESLMDHYSYWDPLVRQVDEKENIIKQLKKLLAQSRGCVEIAGLVLESVVDASRTDSLDESHVRLCEFALDALTEMQIFAAKAKKTAAAA